MLATGKAMHMWRETIHEKSLTSSQLGASLAAQLVKTLPAVQETQARFLGRDGPLEQGRATHSSIRASQFCCIPKIVVIIKSIKKK